MSHLILDKIVRCHRVAAATHTVVFAFRATRWLGSGLEINQARQGTVKAGPSTETRLPRRSPLLKHTLQFTGHKPMKAEQTRT